MFLTSILAKAWEQLVSWDDEEDAAACTGSKEDRFSELPDGLLLDILERVGTFDAIRACVLSKHLLRLPTMLSRVVINGCDVSRDCYISGRRRWDDKPTDLDLNDMIRANHTMAQLTDKILSTRPPQLAIRELKLTFILSHDQCLSISRSVARAMVTLKPDTVHLKILTEKHTSGCTPDDFIRFGRQFNNFYSASQDVFAGLTRLNLENLTLGESDLPNILSTCKRLEYLGLKQCEEHCDAEFGSVLRIEHDRLVELKIVDGKYRTLELCRLPNLQRMTRKCWYYHMYPLVFGFVPQLSKLSLIDHYTSNVTLRLSQLLADASPICDLRLDFLTQKIWVRPETPRVLTPVLGKLRIVSLDNIREGYDMMWTMFILEAAPSLEELCITVWYHWCQEVPDWMRSKKKHVKWMPCDSDFKHDKLAKLTIFGFQPNKIFRGYVARVMEVAVRIKDVSLHDRKVCEFCIENGVKVCPSRYPRTSKEKDSCIKKITGGLMKGSPSVIHFRS